jgi:hypothetical protein
MRHRLVALLFLLGAVVGHAGVNTTFAVSSSTPTQIAPAPCSTCRHIRVENGGPNPIYCAPTSSVTVGTGHMVPAATATADGVAVFPNEGVWCIAASADQAGCTSSTRTCTRVWASDQ